MAETAHLHETLDKLEKTLLEFERALKAGDDFTSWVHLVFQSAHNLKSGMAMADFPASASLVHSLEDEFDALRRGKRQPRLEALDFAMRVIDVLRAGVEAEAEDPSAVDALVRESKSLLQGEQPLAPQPAKAPASDLVSRYGLKLTPAQAALCDQELAAGKALWRVDKLLKNTLTQAQFDTLPVLDDLREAGTLIAIQPGYADFKAGMEEQAVKFLFASAVPEAELKLQIYDPMILQAAPAAASAQTAASRALRILVAEDDLFSSKLLKSLMTPYGEVTLALDGVQTWQAIEAAQAKGQPFDFILLDIMMPHKSGQEILHELRALEEKSGVFGLDRTKVVINSALGDMETVQTAFRDQADGYLVKPFTTEKILAHMQKLKLLKPGQAGGN